MFERLAAVFAYLIRDCLSLNTSDARLVKMRYGMSAEHIESLGYRSAPEPLRLHVAQINGHDATPEELQDHARHRHAHLDAMTDEEFFDWLTYSKEPVELPLADLRARIETLTVHQDMIERALAERFGDVMDVPGLYVAR